MQSGGEATKWLSYTTTKATALVQYSASFDPFLSLSPFSDQKVVSFLEGSFIAWESPLGHDNSVAVFPVMRAAGIPQRDGERRIA